MTFLNNLFLINFRSAFRSSRWWVVAILVVSFVLSTHVVLNEAPQLMFSGNGRYQYFSSPIFWVSVVSDVIGYFLGATVVFFLIFTVMWFLKFWRQHFYFIYVAVFLIYGVYSPIKTISEIGYRKQVARGRMIIEQLKPFIDAEKARKLREKKGRIRAEDVLKSTNTVI